MGGSSARRARAQVFKEALTLLPGGVNSPVRAFKSVGGQPIIFDHVSGPYCFDVDGNKVRRARRRARAGRLACEGGAWPRLGGGRLQAALPQPCTALHRQCRRARLTDRRCRARQYIDYVGSWGPAIVGHAHPEVSEALKEQIYKARPCPPAAAARARPRRLLGSMARLTQCAAWPMAGTARCLTAPAAEHGRLFGSRAGPPAQRAARRRRGERAAPRAGHLVRRAVRAGERAGQDGHRARAERGDGALRQQRHRGVPVGAAAHARAHQARQGAPPAPPRLPALPRALPARLLPPGHRSGPASACACGAACSGRVRSGTTWRPLERPPPASAEAGRRRCCTCPGRAGHRSGGAPGRA